MSPHISWQRPLVALAGGALMSLLVWLFVDSGRAATLAHDLATSIGFPVDTTTDIGHPWAIALLTIGSAWTIWLCLSLRSLAQQFAIFVAALGLCLTGSWLAHIGGGTFPTMPIMAALTLAFIFGQIAAGFGGSPRQQALLNLLQGNLRDSLARDLAASSEPAADVSRDCLVTAIEAPSTDEDFLSTLRRGLLTDGAFLQTREDGILLAIYGLWGDLDETEAWSHLARAVDSLVPRPGGWKLATARGPVRRLLDLGAAPALHLRGRITAELAILLDDIETPSDSLPIWITKEIPPATTAIGWGTEANSSPPHRLRPCRVESSTTPHEKTPSL